MPATKCRVSILGVEIDALSMEEAIIVFEQFIARRRPALVYNVNVDVCMKINRDPSLQPIYRAADLVLADGTPMTFAARFLQTPLPGRVSGSDFVPAFCRIATLRGYRVFFLGAAPGVAERASRLLQARNPGLNVAGTYAPPPGFEGNAKENARTINIVRKAAPDVMFVALGAPKQEKWLFRFRDQLRVPVSMGVGSAFDFLSERLRRAPMWMQKSGLEWTFRLAQEPQRLWRRYLLENPPFIYHVVRERLRKH